MCWRLFQIICAAILLDSLVVTRVLFWLLIWLIFSYFGCYFISLTFVSSSWSSVTLVSHTISVLTSMSNVSLLAHL